MLDDFTEEDRKFIKYLLDRIPINFVTSVYAQFILEHKPITDDDIRTLEVNLKLRRFDKIIKDELT